MNSNFWLYLESDSYLWINQSQFNYIKYSLPL